MGKTATHELPPAKYSRVYDDKVKVRKFTLAPLFSDIGTEAQAGGILGTVDSSVSEAADASYYGTKRKNYGIASTYSTSKRGRINYTVPTKNSETKESCNTKRSTKEMSVKVPSKSLAGMTRIICCLVISALSLNSLSVLIWYYIVLAGRKQDRKK